MILSITFISILPDNVGTSTLPPRIAWKSNLKPNLMNIEFIDKGKSN